MRKIYLLLLVAIAQLAQAQDTLTMVQFNGLKLGGSDLVGATSRGPRFRAVYQYLKPDLITMNEISDQAALTNMVNQVLNVNGISHYAAAPYLPGPDTENGLFYNTSKLGLLRFGSITGGTRDINWYRLFYRHPNLAQGADTIKLVVYVMHLKASQGTTEENQRATEVGRAIAHLAANPVSHAIFAGDFNMYSSTEAGYQALVLSPAAPLRDPINRPGAWHSNTAFADIHTQSPRTASFGGGVNGGLDDRFDFMLVTPNMLTTTDSLQYIPGTYKSVGNDGQHYNLAIIDPPTNTSAPDSVIQGIYYASDHIPVTMKMQVRPYVVSTRAQLSATRLYAHYQQGRLTVSNLPAGAQLRVVDATGRLVFEGTPVDGQTSTGALAPGIYMMQAQSGSRYFIGKVLVIE